MNQQVRLLVGQDPERRGGLQPRRAATRAATRGEQRRKLSNNDQTEPITTEYKIQGRRRPSTEAEKAAELRKASYRIEATEESKDNRLPSRLPDRIIFSSLILTVSGSDLPNTRDSRPIC